MNDEKIKELLIKHFVILQQITFCSLCYDMKGYIVVNENICNNYIFFIPLFLYHFICDFCTIIKN